MDHIQDSGNSSDLAHLSFKTGNILTPVFKILLAKGRKSAEGKGCVNIQGMTKSEVQKDQVTGQYYFLRLRILKIRW